MVISGHMTKMAGIHTIRSVIAENPMLYAHLMALCFIETDLWLIEVLHCGEYAFSAFFAPVTVTLIR